MGLTPLTFSRNSNVDLDPREVLVLALPPNQFVVVIGTLRQASPRKKEKKKRNMLAGKPTLPMPNLPPPVLWERDLPLPIHR